MDSSWQHSYEIPYSYWILNDSQYLCFLWVLLIQHCFFTYIILCYFFLVQKLFLEALRILKIFGIFGNLEFSFFFFWVCCVLRSCQAIYYICSHSHRRQSKFMHNFFTNIFGIAHLNPKFFSFYKKILLFYSQIFHTRFLSILSIFTILFHYRV